MCERRSVPDWRQVFSRLEGAYAPSSIRSYTTDVEAFVQWCHECGEDAFPASPEVLCAFLQDQSVRLSVSTVKRRLYAIRKVHRLLKLDDPTTAEDVQLALRRVRRSKTERPRQAKGMNRSYLDRFIAAQPDTPWGLQNRAMLAHPCAAVRTGRPRDQ
jgi:site-specific recombinase XerD